MDGRATPPMDRKVAGVSRYSSVYLSTYLSSYLAIYLAVFLSVCLSVYLPSVNFNVRISMLLNTMLYLITTPAAHIHSVLSQVNSSLQGLYAREEVQLGGSLAANPKPRFALSFLGRDLGRRPVAGYTFSFSSRVRLWMRSMAQNTFPHPFL